MNWFTDWQKNKGDPNKQAAPTDPKPKAVSVPPTAAPPSISPPVQSPTAPSIPVTNAPPKMESTCPAPNVFRAVDLCQPVTPHFLDVVTYLGVETIIRYYDYVNESLKGKTPKADEIALIKKRGFKMLAVFQHSNNSIETFLTAGRGAKDAKRSLELAALWKQPKGSCIYVGVDFDPSLGKEMRAVHAYVAEFGSIVRNAGFRVGVYGSGLTLETLLDAKLIDLAWLSMSTGFQHSKAFEASKRWALHQVRDRTCGGINVDFDYTNGDIGDWEIQ